MDTLDILKRDRFELLSCYLDGEVTAAERKQVETWLATDSEIQQLHARLLKLRHGLQNLPTPAATQPAEQTIQQVLDRVDRRPKLGLALSLAGAAVAAVFVGTLTGLLPGRESFTPQMVEQPPVEPNNPEALMLALEEPPIEIPQAPAGKSTGKSSGGSVLYPNPNQNVR